MFFSDLTQSVGSILTEAKSDYEKAWEKHRAEIQALKDNGFDHSMSGHRLPDGRVRSTVVKRITVGNDEHNFYIGHAHNNMTRENNDVKTVHYYVKNGRLSGPDFDPGTPRKMEEKDHPDIHSAIKYALDKIKSVKK